MKVLLYSLLIFLLHEEQNPRIEAADDVIFYKLDRKIIPTSYEVILKLNTDWTTTDAFGGTVVINVEVMEEINKIIKLHCKNLNIDKVEVDGEEENDFSVDSVTETITILTAEDISLGPHVIRIEFNGSLSLTDMHGFYKSYYEDSDGTQYLAATQFEATHARRAFPCFDEPDFKAVFSLRIVCPDGYTALSNTPAASESIPAGSGLFMTEFKQTPPMSTYLIAIVISKFTCDQGLSLNGGIPYEVCSRPEANNMREFALEVGPHLMRVLEKFTDRKYSDSGIGKMTQIAIPDFSAGAMENWGLVTYRETGILWDEKESSNMYKQKLANVITHEFTHMWFGNLVTMKWWNDLYLNEGFARYFQYFGTGEIFPCWQLEKQFIIEQVHSTLLVDSKNTSKSLSAPVESPSEISDKFDTISYGKGASVLRMVMNFMGKEQFRAGIRKYLETYENNTTTNIDLWTELGDFADQIPTQTSLAAVMESWTTSPGYPVVKLELNGNVVIASQSRFLLSGEDNSNTKWYVPITYTIPSMENKFKATLPQTWLLPTETTSTILELSDQSTEWIMLNNQQIGYYRVKYDDELLNRIYRGLLKDNFDGIDVISRTQLIDDYFNYARIGDIPYIIILKLMSFLERDTEYYTWYAAFNGFSYVLSKIGDVNLETSLKKYILTQMNALLKSAPLNDEDHDNQIYTLKHAMAHKWACKLDDEDCITNAIKIFANYRENGTSPSKNLRSVVYCTALRFSDDIERDWNLLWTKYMESQVSTEQVTILNSLGCTTNLTVLNRYLGYIIEEKVRLQDNKLIFSSIYNNNVGGVSTVLDFYKSNHQSIVDTYGIEYANSLLGTLAGMITTTTDKQKISSLNNIENIKDSTKEAIASAVTKAEKNLEVVKIIEEQFSLFFNPTSGADPMMMQRNVFTIVAASILMFFNVFQNM